MTRKPTSKTQVTAFATERPFEVEDFSPSPSPSPEVDEGELYVYTGPNPFELLAQTAVLTPASRPASDELCRRVDLNSARY